MNLTELINECIRIKPGNTEFALFFDGQSEWDAHIGNESEIVCLGERAGEFSALGSTPAEAVSNLLETLRGVAEMADAIAERVTGGGMSDIDWSKAPEGATHYLSPFFYREEQNGKVFYMAERAWVTSHYAAGQLEAKGAQRIDKKPAWTGIDLPPVGTVCETWFDDGKACWHECEVIHHKSDDQRLAAVILRGEHKGRLSWGMDFRPIRTPEQIAAEEREKQLEAMEEVAARAWRSVAPGEDMISVIVAALHADGYRKTEAP